jgi:hypothetical protein
MLRSSLGASLLLLLDVFVVPGCVPPRDWTRVGQPEEYSFRQQVEGVTVAVDPWTKSGDVEHAFGKNLTSHGILPIRLIIFNNGDKVIRFSHTQAKLCLADGTELSILPHSAVIARTDLNEGVAPVIIYTVIGGRMGIIIAGAVAGATEEENWKVHACNRSCSMDLATLDPQHGLAGFLLYDCKASQLTPCQGAQRSRLRILQMPRADAAPLSFDIDLASPLK